KGDDMAQEIELSRLDLRHEGCRLKQAALEERLLSSIAQRGIEEPLEGVEAGERSVLLNGFKRCRCARKLRLALVPYSSLGRDEAAGLVSVLRTSNHRALGILEQAAFLAELKAMGGMSAAEMAVQLDRSKSWVSMRLGLLAEMSEPVRRALFAGAFPVYCYMYTLRRFMRMNGVGRAQIQEFVASVGGRGLSVREIEQLAHGFFQGPESFRQEIRNGNLALPLERMRNAPENPDGCSEFERVMLGDLELTQKYMQRVMGKSLDPRLAGRPFHAQSHLLTGGILSRCTAFIHTLRQLYDRNGQA
ncbi:MAG: ParB/RepB/Spo0J family partition protein, partial [Limisphaerales bacterium]